jgi:hypothetical protein
VYRARYRARNSIGWGPFSEASYLLVAQAPAAPLKPQLVSVDETQISIMIPQSVDDFGAVIEGYQLYVNDDIQIAGYDGLSPTYTLTTSDNLIVGTIYRIKTRAYNSIDSGSFSEELIVAFARKPETPAAPTFGTGSTKF